MIFLDVGAHEGQTLEEVTHPGYHWDAVHAFEPMPDQFALLAPYSGRATLHNFGLTDRTGPAPMYGDNSILEASVFADKCDADPTIVTQCEFRSASEWFAENLPDEASAIVKLNCEGAEALILDDLLRTGEIVKAAWLMVDWDVRKVPSMVHTEAELTHRLDDLGVRFVRCEDTMHGDTHQERTRAWLAEVGVTR